MKVTYQLRAKNGATLGLGPFYKVRPALEAISLIRLMRKSGGALTGIRIEDTLAQRWVTRAARLIRTAWAHRDPRYTVAAYSADRYMADMIEGGRWFDTYTLEDSVKVWRKRDRIYFEQEYLGAYPNTGKRYNVNGGEDYTVTWTPRFGVTPSYIDTYVPYS